MTISVSKDKLPGTFSEGSSMAQLESEPPSGVCLGASQWGDSGSKGWDPSWFPKLHRSRKVDEAHRPWHQPYVLLKFPSSVVTLCLETWGECV